MIGFTFAGKYSGDQQVWWTPGKSDHLAGEDFQVVEEEAALAPGGYWLGSRATIRTIALKCFFEDITQRQRREILDWLNKDSVGE